MQCVAERGAPCVASCREKAEKQCVVGRVAVCVCERENERERERERTRETECVRERGVTYKNVFIFIYTCICM